ncbi:MAG: hypothetical protein H7301_01150 [Cryobacterium sp.]|nr:hypothetical protein [Oligoflexia bacterium]
MKKTLLNSLLAAIVMTAFLPSAHAAKFANQFTEFELPPGWACNLEVAEWVCQNTNPAKSKEAIIVLAAKLKGDQDSLDQYLTYLKATKSFTSVGGKALKSEPKYAKTLNVNGHPWVDALHLESEIPGFYTRYLATVKDDIGVLVTYSIAKAKYQDYLKDFDNLVNTLKVFRKAGGINIAPANTNLLQPNIPTTISGETVFPGVNPQGGSDAPAPKRAAQNNDLILYGVIGVAAVALFIIKKRKG